MMPRMVRTLGVKTPAKVPSVPWGGLVRAVDTGTFFTVSVCRGMAARRLTLRGSLIPDVIHSLVRCKLQTAMIVLQPLAGQPQYFVPEALKY
jgi:hypothetical protein